MDALKSIVAIVLVGIIGVTPSSCATMGGETNGGGIGGGGNGGGGGGYLIELPSEFVVL